MSDAKVEVVELGFCLRCNGSLTGADGVTPRAALIEGAPGVVLHLTRAGRPIYELAMGAVQARALAADIVRCADFADDKVGVTP